MRGYQVRPGGPWAVVGGKWKSPSTNAIFTLVEVPPSLAEWHKDDGFIYGVDNPIIDIPPGTTNFYTYDNPQDSNVTWGQLWTIGCSYCKLPSNQGHSTGCIYGNKPTPLAPCKGCGAKDGEVHHYMCQGPEVKLGEGVLALRKTYKCLQCNNTNLDSRDLEMNPATGNIWGCNKCGSKKLEAF